jgi:hypothetical protein
MDSQWIANFLRRPGAGDAGAHLKSSDCIVFGVRDAHDARTDPTTDLIVTLEFTPTFGTTMATGMRD